MGMTFDVFGVIAGWSPAGLKRMCMPEYYNQFGRATNFLDPPERLTLWRIWILV
jgi:hypothetical protein